jgi:type IV pilus assembly protein PilB
MAEGIVNTRVGAMTYLAPGGQLCADDAIAELQAAVAACIAAHRVQLMLDLAMVPLVNGKALEVMLDSHARLKAMGGGLKVLNPNALLREVFHLTGFSAYVDTGDSEGRPAPQPGRGEGGRKLGDILVANGAISAERLKEAMQVQQQLGQRLGQILVEKGFVSEVDLLKALSAQLDVPYVALRPGLYDPAALALLDKDTARRLEVMPLFRVHGTLMLATRDPQAVPTFDEVAARTHCRVRPVLARRDEILKLVADAYDTSAAVSDFVSTQEDDLQLLESGIPDDYTRIDEMAGASPVINMVNAVIQRAIRDRASDIHIENSRARARIRFRVDGVLYDIMTPRQELYPALVSRLKVMANLDIAERRMPQDGRIQVATQGRTVDLRFSSLPGIFGEKVVLRVLDKSQSILDVDKLAMGEDNLRRFKALLKRSHGLLLVTGPTGSGKTTSLYAAINHLKSAEKNIVTIEDPVEFQLDVINQNQVNEPIGLSFARMLKHVLRQDPDIIMVGEIRDRDTAEIAVQASLTGHLVLSTLHTNDAVGAVSRMLDMGVEPYLLASALAGVLAQRLVRRICEGCKTTYLAPPELVAACGFAAGTTYQLARGRGCTACYDSGYKGRIAIHELIDVDPDLQRLIVARAGMEELRVHTGRAGHKNLHADGMERVLARHTTPEEIARAIHLQ